jgi:hypothetical protein
MGEGGHRKPRVGAKLCQQAAVEIIQCEARIRHSDRNYLTIRQIASAFCQNFAAS